MKRLLILLGILLLVGTASATTWTSASGCWTATDGSYSLVMWNTTGTNVWTVPTGVYAIDYVVVAGGGGGGGCSGASCGGVGGGGAGGLLNGSDLSVVGGNLTLVVGSGGVGGFTNGTGGFNGTNSSLSYAGGNITAVGGGGGGGNELPGYRNGKYGGSGGGAYYDGIPGLGITGQGFWGGTGIMAGVLGGGGGGGSSSPGVNGSVGKGGNGGNGTIIYITGEPLTLAGGGGGGVYNTSINGTGGSGIGGNGGNTGSPYGKNATASTGSGGGGGGSLTESAGGGYGSSGVIIIKYLTASNRPVASFTSNVTRGTQPLSVQFNDTSVTSITNWLWNFGEGNTSTVQNATNVFYNGNHHVSLNVTNASGYSIVLASGWINVSDSGGLTGWNRQDIMMDQIYTVTFNVKDSRTHNGLPGTIVMLSNGDNSTTDLFGSVSFSMNYSVIVAQFAATGYQSRTSSYVIDRNRVETVYMTAQSASNASEPFRGTNPLYPQQIQFILVDKYGHILTDVAVTSTMVSMSINGTNWLTELFQISPNATPIDTTVLNDTSDDAGTVVFPMIASGTYRLTFDKPSAGIHESKEMHPTQPYYIFILTTTDTAPVANLRDSVNASLGTYPPASDNPPIVYLQGNYTDTLSQTTNVTFYVLYPNQTPLYSNSTTGTVSSANFQYAVNNTAGSGYVWGTSALRGTTYINKSTGITMKGTGSTGLANSLIKYGCTDWECKNV